MLIATQQEDWPAWVSAVYALSVVGMLASVCWGFPAYARAMNAAGACPDRRSFSEAISRHTDRRRLLGPELLGLASFALLAAVIIMTELFPASLGRGPAPGAEPAPIEPAGWLLLAGLGGMVALFGIQTAAMARTGAYPAGLVRWLTVAAAPFFAAGVLYVFLR